MLWDSVGKSASEQAVEDLGDPGCLSQNVFYVPYILRARWLEMNNKAKAVVRWFTLETLGALQTLCYQSRTSMVPWWM